ncbi:hypothetical protein SGPA1_20683 [Streptomyces misionensis JCM 4497]
MSLPKLQWAHGYRRRSGGGGSPAAADPQGAGGDAGRAVRGHRHLREHAVPAGVRAAQAQPGAAAADRPGPPGPAGRTGRRAAGRRSPGAHRARAALRPHLLAADPPAGRPPGLQGARTQAPGGAGPAHPRGVRVAVRALRAAAAGARRARRGAVGRGGGRVRHPGAALVRVDGGGAGGVPEPVRAAGGADACAGTSGGAEVSPPEGCSLVGKRPLSMRAEPGRTMRSRGGPVCRHGRCTRTVSRTR